MGVPTSEVHYTPAMSTREDHEVHKGHVVALENNIYISIYIYIYTHTHTHTHTHKHAHQPRGLVVRVSDY